MATQKRKASVLGSTLTSLTLNSDLSSTSTDEESSETDDEDAKSVHQTYSSHDNDTGHDTCTDVAADDSNLSANKIATFGGKDVEVEVSKKLTKPKPLKSRGIRLKTLTIDGRLVYFCILCDKIFTRRKEKLNHELTHNSKSETVFTCTECGKEYFHESSLAYHMRSHDADQLHLCDLCPKMFAQGHQLKTHILSHSQPTEFTCKTCYQDFAQPSDLSVHTREKIKVEMRTYWCKICKVYLCRNHFNDVIKRLNEYQLQLHAHQCFACNELFFSRKKLRLHAKKFAHKFVEKPKLLMPLSHEEIDSMKRNSTASNKAESIAPPKLLTSSCNNNKEVNAIALKGKRQFDDADDVKPFAKRRRRLHNRSHIEEEAIQSSSSLQDSNPELKEDPSCVTKSPIKGRKGKPYCKKCNKSFKDASDLDTHKLQMHGEATRVFACEICSKRFPSLKECDDHKTQQHRKEEMNLCPICGMEFYHWNELNHHMKEHSSDFPYKCNQCDMSFRLKIQLIQHTRLHIPDQTQHCLQITCDLCDVKLSGRKEFDDHMKEVHNQHGSFKCDICAKAFLFQYKLQDHLRVHASTRTFQCYMCDKKFSAKHFLQRHLQSHLKGLVEEDDPSVVKNEVGDSKTVDSKISREEGEMSGNDDADVCNDESFPYTRDTLSLVNFRFDGWKKKSLKKPGDSSSLRQLDIMKIRVELSSDSCQSNCSMLTRESEKSDPFRFSSDGSDSLKFTLAKERRKLKKRRQLSRVALLNKLNALKNAQSPCDELAEVVKDCDERMKEDESSEDENEKIQHMSVEINGVVSPNDNEVTIYVDLREMQSPTPAPPCRKLSDSFDSTDKENRLPMMENDALFDLEWFKKLEKSLCLQSDANTTMLSDATATDCKKTVVFDLDVNSDDIESLLSNYKSVDDVKISCKNQLDNDNSVIAPSKVEQSPSCAVSSHIPVKVEPVLAYQHSWQEVKLDNESQSRKSGLNTDAFSSSTVQEIKHVHHDDVKSHLIRPRTKSERQSDHLSTMQPLQSLVSMTSQIEDKRDENKRKPYGLASFNSLDVSEDIPKSNHATIQSHNPSPNSGIHASPKLSSLNKSAMVIQQSSCMKKETSYSDMQRIPDKSVIRSHVGATIQYAPSKVKSKSKSKNSPPKSKRSSMDGPSQSHSNVNISSHPGKSTNRNPSYSISSFVSSPQVVNLPPTSNMSYNPISSALICSPRNVSSYASPLHSYSHYNDATTVNSTNITNSISHTYTIKPELLTPPGMKSPKKLHRSMSNPGDNFSRTHVQDAIPSCFEPKIPASFSKSETPDVKPNYSNATSANVGPGTPKMGDMFDTQNPTLRNINMMDLVASNRKAASTSSSTYPLVPTPIFASPSNINTNILPPGNEMASVSVVPTIRPIAPSPINPTMIPLSQSQSLSFPSNLLPYANSSNATFQPHVDTKPILVNDNPASHPAVGVNFQMPQMINSCLPTNTNNLMPMQIQDMMAPPSGVPVNIMDAAAMSNLSLPFGQALDFNRNLATPAPATPIGFPGSSAFPSQSIRNFQGFGPNSMSLAANPANLNLMSLSNANIFGAMQPQPMLPSSINNVNNPMYGSNNFNFNSNPFVGGSASTGGMMGPYLPPSSNFGPSLGTMPAAGLMQNSSNFPFAAMNVPLGTTFIPPAAAPGGILPGAMLPPQIGVMNSGLNMNMNPFFQM